MNIRARLGLPLAITTALAAPSARAHEYFVPTGQIQPGATIQAVVGKPLKIEVNDQGSCQAVVTAIVTDTAIATVTPEEKEGENVSFMITGLTVGSTTITFHVQGFDEDDDDNPCTEDSMNPFTLCVAPDATDSAKQLKSAATQKLKELKNALKQEIKAFAAQNATVLQTLAAGGITHEAAAAQLAANVNSRLAGLNPLWVGKTEELAAIGRQILQARQFPACAQVPSDFAFGTDGVWQDFVNAAAGEARTAGAKINKLFEGQIKTFEKIPQASDAPGGKQISITHRAVVPESLYVPFGPGTPDPLPALPSSPVILGGISGVRPKTDGPGTLLVTGIAEAGEFVRVSLSGAGSATADVAANPNGYWETEFTGLGPGDYAVTAGYVGDSGAAATIATLR